MAVGRSKPVARTSFSKEPVLATLTAAKVATCMTHAAEPLSGAVAL